MLGGVFAERVAGLPLSPSAANVPLRARRLAAKIADISFIMRYQNS
jgi:hypothetical protein